jgi:hypothetical protein
MDHFLLPGLSESAPSQNRVNMLQKLQHERHINALHQGLAKSLPRVDVVYF